MNTCKTCQWWSAEKLERSVAGGYYSTLTGYGLCNCPAIIDVSNDADIDLKPDGAAVRDCDSDAALFATGPDFGCVHHHPANITLSVKQGERVVETRKPFDLFASTLQSRLSCTYRGQPIGDADMIAFGADNPPAMLTIPKENGISNVISECGRWMGQIKITETEEGRFVEWLYLNGGIKFTPADLKTVNRARVMPDGSLQPWSEQ